MPAGLSAQTLLASTPSNAVVAKPSQDETSTLPLVFIPNVGQTDKRAQFIADGKGGALFFTPEEVVLALPAEADQQGLTDPNQLSQPWRTAAAVKQLPTVLRTLFVGANTTPIIKGGDQLPGLAHFLIGDDPTAWHTDIPTYGAIVYQELYHGIDLRYDGANGRIKSTYTLAPDADLSLLRWRYDGAQQLRLDHDGNLVIKLAPPHGRATEDRVLTEQAPTAWQDISGKRVAVTAAFALANDGTVSFTLGAYDPNYPLTIDPIITFSSYLGGSGKDLGNSIAVGGDGSIYLSGNTNSTNFPLTSPFQNVPNSYNDILITKIQNGIRVYSTYFGGNDDDFNNGIAVDSSNQIYVTGNTISTNLPMKNAYDTTPNGSFDVFLTKLNVTGSALLYSTL